MIQVLADTAVTKPAAVLLLSQTPELIEQIAQIAEDARSGHPIYRAFTLETAVDLESALEKAQEEQIDLALLDWAAQPEYGAAAVTSLCQLAPVVVIVTEESQAITAVTAGARDYLLLSELDKNNLLRLVHHLGDTAVQIKLLAEEREAHEMAEALRDIANILHSTLDVEQLLDQVLTQIERLVPYDLANVAMVEDGRTRIVRLRGYENFPDMTHYSVDLDKSETYGRVAATKQPLLIPDTFAYPGWDHFTDVIRSWLCVPIILKEHVIAMLALDKFEPDFYQPIHVERLMSFVAQVEAALEKARLYEALQRQLAELTVLHTIAVSTAGIVDENKLIEQMTAIIGNTLYPANFGVLLYDEKADVLRIQPSYVMNENAVWFDEISLSDGIVGYVARTRQPYMSGDVTQDPYYLKGYSPTRSEICVPFASGDQLLGVINVESPEYAAFNEDDQRFLVTLANHLGNSIVKIRLFAAEKRRRHEAEILHQAAVALGSTLDLNTLLNTLLDFLGQLIPYDSASVMLLEENQFVVQAGRGHEKWTDQPVIGLVFSMKVHHLLRKMMNEEQMIIVADTQIEPLWEGHETTRYIRNWLGVPLVAGGEIIGCYGLDKAQPHFFTEEHFRIAEALAAQTAVAIQNIQLYQTAQQQARNQQLSSTILQDLNATPEVYEVFPKVSATLKQLSGCTRVTLALFDGDLQTASIYDMDQSMKPQGEEMRVALADSSAAEDILDGRIHATPDLAVETPSYRNVRKLYRMGIRSRVNIPLHSGKQIIGSLNLSWTHTHGFDKTHFPLFQQTATAIALALERSKLFDAVKQWAHQLGILHELGRQITGLVDVRELCQTAVTHLSQSLNHLSVSLYAVDHITQEVVLEAVVGPNSQHLTPGEYRQKLGEGLLGRAAQTGERQLVNDTLNHPDFIVCSRFDVRSELVIPLRAGNTIVGVLNVDSDKENSFGDSDVSILTIAADQLAIALGKAQLFDETKQRTAELEQRNQELEAIYRIGKALAGTLDLQEVYRIIFREIVQNVLNSPHFTIARLDEKAQIFYCEFGIIDSQEMPPANFPPMPLGDGPMSETARSRKGRIISYEEVLPQLEKGSRVVQIGDERRPKSGICVPLVSGDKMLGVMFIQHYKAHAYSEADLTLLSLLANQASMAIENARLYRQAQQHADELEQRVAERTSELAEANKSLQELDRLKSKFVADVSHELRTPITNLGLYLDLIEQGNPDKQKQYIATLRKQANRLANLIEDTLNLSRIELGRGRVTFHSFALNDVVNSVITAHMPSIGAAGLTLMTDLSPDLPKLYGERNQLAQVVANLLGNAINYTPSGSIRVATRWDAETKEVLLMVADTGIGIDPEEASLLFDRFYRGGQVSQSNIPGTGLGLAIVKEIVDLHAGTIEVDGRPGEGATFTVRFPVYVP